MRKRTTVTDKARRRGNPNWGLPPEPLPDVPTEFERQVKRLGLTSPDYVRSDALRRWCWDNRDRFYIPEWLLQEWGIKTEATFSGIG